MDACRSRYNHPMLGTVVMDLHGGFLARFDHDLLDVVALSIGDGIMTTPRAEYFSMLQLLGATRLLKLGYDPLDLLNSILMSHQNRILGFDYHQIFDTNSGRQPML
ncbi:hypothetical protein D3C78_1610510 [compost metagenome]